MSSREIDSKVKELRELRRFAEEIAAEIDALTDAIKAEMLARSADEISGSDWRITWKTVKSSRIDTTALKKAMPDIASAFTRESESRRFVLA